MSLVFGEQLLNSDAKEILQVYSIQFKDNYDKLANIFLFNFHIQNIINLLQSSFVFLI